MAVKLAHRLNTTSNVAMNAEPDSDAVLPVGVLLREMRNGNDSALNTLIQRHLPRLRAFVRLRIGQLRELESSSDIVQSVFLELLKRTEFEYRGEERFRGWLFATALNKLRERRRAGRTVVRATEAETQDLELSDCYTTLFTPERQILSNEDILRLEAVFDRLPPRYAEVITLRRIAGLGFESISRELGCTEQATRKLLQRALARFGTMLERAGFRRSG